MKRKLDLFSPNIFLPIATAIFLILYLVTLQAILAVLCLAAFLTYVAVDFLSTSKEKGRVNLLEIIYAIIGAAAIWLALSMILSTPSPLDVVTSCSMNNELNRGDLIIVQGQSSYNAPVINYTGERPIIHVEQANCSVSKRGFFSVKGTCTSNLSVTINANTYSVSTLRSDVKGNDIIIFESNIAGLVIHRAIAVFHNIETGEIVYLTKGDNNQVVDQEAGIDFVKPEKIHGKFLVRIPLVGYFRLFLAGQFTEPAGCNTLVT